MESNRRHLGAINLITAAVFVAGLGVLAILVASELRRHPQGLQGTEFSYDLQRYESIEGSLFAYRLSAEIPLSFERPTGIAVRSGETVYVCGDRKVVSLDGAGTEIEAMQLESEPRCIAVDDTGAVYVAMERHIEVFHPETGIRDRWADFDERALITSLAVAGDTVFVADAGSRTVLRFDRDGMLRGRIADGFLVPSPYFDVVARDDIGLFVVDPGRHEVRSYDFGGRQTNRWGRYGLDIGGFGGCCNPIHLALLPDGSFVTSEKGIARVKVYTPEGTLASVVAGPRDLAGDYSGFDVAADDRGRVYVLRSEIRRIAVYERGGTHGEQS